MNQVFKLENEKGWKTLLLTGTNLLLVNKKYTTPEEFIEKFHEKGLLKERLELSVLDVCKITHPQKESGEATITYKNKEADKELLLNFETTSERDQFIKEVVKHRQMTSTETEVNFWNVVKPFVIGLGLTAFFCYITYADAKIIENGGTVNTSGRRSVYKKIFAWLAEIVGTQGAIAAGVLFSLLFIYFAYRKFQNRPLQVVYE